MPTNLRELLQKYRSEAASEREKGTYFERLTKVWLETAPTQREQFSRVLTYADWARESRFDQRDTGIDLVAQIADSPNDWCAIQCVNGGKISGHWGGVKPGQLGAIADMQRGPIGPLCMSAAK